MQGSDPPPYSERPSATGSWRAAAPGSGSDPAPNDSPTVLSGQAGSSNRRAQGGYGGHASPLPHPGDRLESFELEEAIGVGGMGAVFRALDSRLDRHVALKILPPEQANDPEVVQRFYQEGRAAARLDHENIARVFSIGHDAGFHFIAFEFIEGVTIRQRVERDGPLGVGEAVNYTLQIASALVHAAERGVVHRDIKPSNIIVTPHGRAKLVDMGLARRFERGGDDGLTQSGMTLGTFDYISPEQARDPRDVDVRSDLYSLGCTLFHMLTGRPPFPEGTVLQKLISHQEELPPDVRMLNPMVPADLAAILTKLMAKERDRRYQTPEQLVRDLLILAGALGLRSVSPEGLIWMSAARPPAWERHLVWGIPVAAFAIVLIFLVWWGQDTAGPGTPALSTAPSPVARIGSPKPTEPSPRSTASAEAKPDEHERAAAERTETAAPASRDISVDSSDDLLAIIASAPRRSTIVLADDGPYILTGATDRRDGARLIDRDVTIKADAGVHPVVRLARESGTGGKSPSAIFEFVGGRVTLEGLEFVLMPDGREDAASVRVENTELTVRRCLFRRQGSRAIGGRIAALEVRSTTPSATGDRPAALMVDACHFDPGQVAVLSTGVADVQASDCTIAAAEPAFWFEKGKRSGAIPVDLQLRHTSILAGDSPVFRFAGVEPRVRIEDTVIAPAGDVRGTLVTTDAPEELDWRGRSNLYGRIGVYLQPSGSRSGRGVIRDATRWSESLAAVRETGLVTTDDRVWEESDPVAALTRETEPPARAFRLSQTSTLPSGIGPRQGPLDVAQGGLALNSSTPEPSRQGRTEAPASPKRTVEPEPDDPERDPMAPMPMAVPAPANPPAPMVRAPGDTSDVPAMPPMRNQEEVVKEETGNDANREKSGNASTEKTTVAEANPRPTPPEADPSVLRTADQFLNAIAQRGRRGGLLTIAADANWELSETDLPGSGRWTLRAESGATRPRIRFRPSAEPRTLASWACWVELKSGSLQLEGIDVILAKGDAPREGRWAAFGVWGGTDLSLTRCTVTIEGERAPSAVVAVLDDDREDGPARVAPSAATVRVSESLLRTGGDLVEVAQGQRLDLDLDDAVVSTGGSMVHAHGEPRGESPEPIRLKLVLRRVTARMVGGLVQLASAPGEPDLPVADVNARDSILATTPQGDPLLHVDGQDSLATLRDRIAWEGHGIAYHRINTYRRDQSAQVGTVPNLYDRPSWTVAVGSREESSIHGDAKFAHDWDPTRSAWTLRREDIRLDQSSPAASAGADPANIPEPPSNSL